MPFENTEFDNTQRALNFHLRDGPTVYWPIVSIVAYYIKYKWDNENGKVVKVWYTFHLHKNSLHKIFDIKKVVDQTNDDLIRGTNKNRAIIYWL